MSKIIQFSNLDLICFFRGIILLKIFICERFHKTIQNEFYAVAFRRKIYNSIEKLQHDLDEWMNHYNYERTHQGKKM